MEWRSTLRTDVIPEYVIESAAIFARNLYYFLLHDSGGLRRLRDCG
jgi:hypothetical protein